MKNIETKGALSWMAQNRVAANLLMVFLLLGGLIIARNTVQEVFPEISLDTVFASVSYPGASPEEVDEGIILPIEEAISDIDGIKEVISTAKEGVGTVSIEAVLGTDLQKLKDDVKDAIDKITSFPDDAEEPSVVIPSRKREVLYLTIYGDLDDITLRNTAENIRLKLLEHNEISQVDLTGIKDLEMSVEVSGDTLKKYNLKLGDIANKIKAASIDLPGGTIKTKEKDILIRLKEKKNYTKEFAKIPIITNTEGDAVYLSDIAKIKDGFAETNSIMTYNGKPAINIEVYRVGKQTPVTVSDAVKEKIEEIKSSLPEAVHIDIPHDRSDMYKDRLDLLISNAFIGLILVFFLLGLFLEIKLAFWVTIGIPISFLGSFLFIPQMGVTINMISLFAFIVSLGIVVDDAIVVGENIYQHRQLGKSFIDSAIYGAKEISTPVIFSVLTNMVAFSPLYFVPGVMGKVFMNIPVVVISVFAISLIESLLILPAHLSHKNRAKQNRLMSFINRKQQAFNEKFKYFIENVYSPFLQLSLKFRYVSFTIAILILVIVFAYIKSGRMGFSLFPKVESDFAYIEAVLPYGSSIEEGEKIQQILFNSVNKTKTELGGSKQVKNIMSRINDNVVTMRIFMESSETRPYHTNEFVQRWRENTGNIAGLESLKFVSNLGGPGSNDAELTIDLSHQDLDVLKKASKELAEEIGKFSIASDIDDGFAPGKEQIDFVLKKEAYMLGLTPTEIANQIRNSYYGKEVLKQLRGRNEIKITVRLPKNERVSEYNLNEMEILSPNGTFVPLRDIVHIKKNRAYIDINRRNSKRIITVSSDVNPPSRTPEIISVLKSKIFPKLKRKYPGLNFSFEGKQAQQKESLDALKQGALIAFILIYTLLAIPFKSYIHPLIIMISIPFGIIGAVTGHLIMGYTLSLLSIFGIMALAGVVINDALVLIDFANRKVRENSTPFSAIVNAGLMRFRPILLTTLTTFFGLAPMIFETSMQARFLIPMAISLGFGILFSTLIILVLVPALYLIIEDFKKIVKKTLNKT